MQKADFISKGNMALNTDLYQLTMAQAYFENNHNEEATFDLFVRKLPSNRSYLIAAGLSQALNFLENAMFDDVSINYLRDALGLKKDFLEFLVGFRFSGDVRSVPEGTPVFENEPILSVTAPLIESQI